jgi:RNA polymerase sigma-70 factor (ECF subfamily)
MLSRLTMSYEADPALREDLLQDIAFSIWKALPSFRGTASLKTFVARVAHNRAVDHVIKRQRIADRHGSPEDPSMLKTASGAAPSDHLDLATAIRSLPLPYRQCMELMLEGFSHAEIGEILGLEENTIAQRLSRGRKRLRTLLIGEKA